ncbi:FMNH2-dependent monooxygenase [Subtercola boreus]|uniref:FMNH2-dependent monooxygenase n=1 Tax=Subtercola boreus TaxID=120213 RepID=A0A3E0VK88_9MICO|nr:NtaA/DmoA family FMN-dependent monooxygenase [Subtercola boreus]RFA09908.1 FMNH2-dependent monooxygenase [Subtercola boreus]TQL52957.1 FMN-dependent oxidoreductase (nitrilotriacetate monooxygenase family) [Subtercola boreus]
MTVKPFHLGWFLNGTSVPAWGQPFSGAIGTQWQSAEIFVDLARAMERACFDYVLIEDNTFVGDRYGDSMEVYLKHAFQAPRQDPMIVATLLAQATSKLGIIPTAGSFAYHPYMLARLVGSLDQLSKGRMGVNLVTGTSDRALQNYGYPGMGEHDSRYDTAEDFINASLALWDTWEPDAVVADVHTGVWADHTKVHRADFESATYSTRGPLNSGPLPQGRPIISQAGGSPRGIAFAAKYADTVIAIQATPAKMKEYRDKVREAAVSFGRNPDDVKVLFGIWPTIGSSQSEADDRIAAARAGVAANLEVALAAMAKSTDIDFANVPLDVPLGELGLSTNGTQQFAEFSARNATLTLREATIARSGAAGPALAGTPDHVAGLMEDIMAEVGGDGFLIGTNGVTRRFIAEITDGLVPELQRRGLTRRGYSFDQLRDNLLEF